MPTTTYGRAHVGASGEPAEKPVVSPAAMALPVSAQHMFVLMLRNVTSDGFVLVDPQSGEASRPGCVIAAPSYPRHTPGVNQDYVFNWVRDAALTAMEIAAATGPFPSVGGDQTLIDYVNFARLCQLNAQPTLGHACFTIGGEPRPWTEQSDGPALQTLAALRAYPRLDASARAVADELIRVDLAYLLSEYRNPTTNLWEEHNGLSFFARSVQLRCFQEVAANALGIADPAGLEAAIAWLRDALDRHWNGAYYVSVLAPPSPGDAGAPGVSADLGYDPNIDIVSACLYGAVAPTDPKLLATAARIRSQWADPGAPDRYAINASDQERGLGPLLGRYPGDLYDGDTQDQQRGGHPWPVCTCNFAELYYTLANGIDAGGPVPFGDLSKAFFAQIGVGPADGASQVAAALREAGDRMLQAVVFHSDHLELSEQFDGASGYEKSVTNLTWSYAAFLSAVRARTGQTVAG